MLCPQCGKDVGNEVKLCAQCAPHEERPTEPEVAPQVPPLAAEEHKSEELQGESSPQGLPPEKELEPSAAVEQDPVPESKRAASSAQETGHAKETGYAGLWLRFLAYWLDVGIIGFFLVLPISLIIKQLLQELPALVGVAEVEGEFLAYALPKVLVISFIYFAFFLVYFAISEGSKLGASPGKYFFGLGVQTTAGQRCSILRALLRNLLKIPSLLSLLGVLIALFTARKQALHDLLTSSVIVKVQEASFVKGLFGIFLIFALPSVSGEVGRLMLEETLTQVSAALESSSGEIESPDEKAASEANEEQAVEPEQLEPGSLESGRLESETSAESSVSSQQLQTPSRVTGSASARLSGSEPSKIVVQDVVAVYYPQEELIEVGFFRDPLEMGLKQTALKTENLAALGERSPDLTARIYLVRGTRFCSIGTISAYEMKIRQRQGALGVEGELKFGKSIGGIANIACQVQPNGGLTIELEQVATQERQGQRAEFRWSLVASTPLLISERPLAVRFDSSSKYPLALWDKEKHLLEVAFFERKLFAADRAAVRAGKSLFAVPGKQPLLTLSFEMKEGVGHFSQEVITTYGVHFHRAAQAKEGEVEQATGSGGFSFPGNKNAISFFYVVTTEQSELLANLDGMLSEGREVRGALRREQLKKIEKQNYTFSWDVVFSAPVIDIAVSQPEELLSDEQPVEASEVSSGANAVLEVGSAKTKLVDAVALYYPQESHLVLGFYPTQLEEAEVNQVLANQGVWNAVNNKRPYLVLQMELDKGVSAVKPASVKKIKLTIVRDSLGDFYFTGQSDRIVVELEKQELTDETLPHLSGAIADGSPLVLRLLGDDVTKKIGMYVAWDVSARVPLRVVR